MPKIYTYYKNFINKNAILIIYNIKILK
jgi:hypothetical protein